MSAPQILVIDDDQTIREALVAAFEDAGYGASSLPGLTGARERIAADRPELVFLDVRLKDGDGIELLAVLRAEFPQLPVVIATAYGDSDRTIRAMKLGAFDYVTKPFDLDALLAVVARAVRTPRVGKRLEAPASESAFVGSSPAMLQVWKIIGRAAGSDAPVLVTGESGVGKELVARAIHEHGSRRGPFVAVNVAALPPSLVESELFGHERGAFTGATTRRAGRFEVASEGTLFLDEIGDLPPSLQTKLLRVLENGSFERVGDSASIVSRARIVAATSRPIAPRSEGSTIREDLYYRLGVVSIHVPPLRERLQDIPLLVDSFLRRWSGPRRAVSEGAMDRLLAFSWPGNVRQLKHVVESSLVLSASEVLDADDLRLPEESPTSAPTAPGEPPTQGPEDLELRSNLERLERKLIERSLEVAKGNRALAARLLGIRRALLYDRMRHFGILGKRSE
ncbi:MAG: sigma-54-dependent Fis family transcriptional regulator [Myxococcales bacterium]|nr:sigma-54-dependent Fis family transcriptional regulator [Myxococcales bacterium]